MLTVALRNLGCSKNVVDGESILAFLESGGTRVASDPSRADIIILNTCAFIQEAKEEAIDEILRMAELKKRGRCSVLAVTGCFSQRYRTQARARLPEVDLWCGLSDWKKKLASFLKPRKKPSPFPPRHLTGLRATQYLKIADGCSHRCSFCAIPFIRGPYRSRSLPSVLDEARWLQDQGVKECILVSQDTTRYGSDRGTSLVRLCEALLGKTSFAWIRLMYLYPGSITGELLSLMAAETRMCPYFDVPFQHSAPSLLRAMYRSPDTRATWRLLDNIRTTVPYAAIRTTFITGFPGETSAHFRHLARFVERARFDKLGVFPYSPEEGTKAYTLGGRVRDSTAMRRCEALLEMQRDISREICESHVGRTVPVIIDRRVPGNSSGRFEGRTQWDAPEIDGVVHVRARTGTLVDGDIVDARICSAGDYDLFARTG